MEFLLTGKMFFTTALLGLAFVVACGDAPTPVTGDIAVGDQAIVAEGDYRDVTVGELQNMLAGKDFLLVNVHIPIEGDIPGTDFSFPFDEIQQNLSSLPVDKEAKIILYCRSDRMSGIAAAELLALGYTNIWNLVGGSDAWIQAGLPFEAN